MLPPRNDDRNDMLRSCAVCGTTFPPAGRRRYCTDACRQAAWRRRAAAARPEPGPLPAARPRREGTIYQCPGCDARYLSEQWCPGCTRPCRRLGPGGACPCGELLTISELLSGA
jgi:hypothetical protein